MSGAVYLVDASIYIFRAWFSLPDAWHAPGGYSVNALVGYVQFWLGFFDKVRPQSVVAAYDESLGSCFRNDLYPGYKASRALPDADLAFQLEACKSFTEILGVASPASERYEADDIIATLAGIARRRGRPVVIVSRDKDLAQLLRGRHDRLWDFAADRTLDRSEAQRQFGVTPQQLPDYLALVGDRIDDIPGVPGLGPKTAAVLLREFGDIEGIFRHLDRVPLCGFRGASAMADKLDRLRDQIVLSRQLTGLYTEVPLRREDCAMRWRPPSTELIRCFLKEFGIERRFEKQLERCDWCH